MAYANAIYYLDFTVTGGTSGDGARATLSGVVFSNPSADVVLGTYVGHGLVTGAVIDVTGCGAAYANDAWKITRVNDDTFTVDDASWALWTDVDVTGDVVPRGGQSWADAWATITTGATAARIAPGDIIKIAKSPSPSSIGNATWTDLSKTITLAGAQTATIDNCESAWTSAGGADTTVILAAVQTAKQGSYCMKLAFDASPKTGILQAYFATGTLNLSAYQKLSFWIQNSDAVTAGTLKIALCSDTAGATPVDYFDIPAIPSTGRWLPLTLTKSGGGNLGSSIQSIALYTDAAVTGLASKYIYVDNFIACTTAGLNLQSLISKNSLEQGGTEGWYGIQSIDGVTVLLDNDTITNAGAGRGYSRATETVPTYIRETIKTAMAASATAQVETINDSGTDGNNIQYQGGWNTSTNEQTGETFLDGLSGYGYGIYVYGKMYNTLNYLSAARYSYGVYFNSSNNNTITTLTNANNNYYGVYFNSSNNNTITTLTNANNNNNYGVYFTGSHNNTITTLTNANNNNYGVYFTSSNNNTITTLTNANNNNYYGVYFTGSHNNTITTLTNANNNNYGVYFNSSNNNTIGALSTTGNGTSAIYTNNSTNYIFSATMAEATKVSLGTLVNLSAFLGITKLNETAGRWYREHICGIASDQITGGQDAAWANGGSGLCQYLNPSSTTYYLPEVFFIPCTASTPVQCHFSVKKTSAAATCTLTFSAMGSGITAIDQASVTLTDSWAEYTSASMTPTDDGFIRIELKAKDGSTTGDIGIDDIHTAAG